MARFRGAKAKDCSSGAQCLIHEQVAQTPLWKPSVWGLRPAATPVRPRGPRPRGAELLCLCLNSAPVGWRARHSGAQALTSLHLCPHLGTREHTKCLWTSLSVDYISLGLGRGKVSFRLTHLSNSWICTGPSLHPIPFLDFPRLVSSPVVTILERACLQALLSLLASVHGLTSPCHVGFYCMCSQQRTFSYGFLLRLIITL